MAGSELQKLVDEMRGKNEDKGFKMNDKKTKIAFFFLTIRH